MADYLVLLRILNLLELGPLSWAHDLLQAVVF